MGIILSGLLFVFYMRASLNLELSMIILFISISQALSSQSINKKIIFDSNNNTVTIIPLFFLQRWAAEYIFKSTKPIPIKEFPEVKLNSSFKRYSSRYALYLNKGLFGKMLLEFNDKETAETALQVINKLRYTYKVKSF